MADAPACKCANGDQSPNCCNRLRLDARLDGYEFSSPLLPHHGAHKAKYCELLAWSDEHGIPMHSVGNNPPVMWFQAAADALAFKLRWQ